MKTFVLSTITLLSTVFLSAQASSVESSTFGLQIGVFGTWAYYETKISDPVALRLEVGAQAGALSIATPTGTNDIAVFVSPEITIEPRFYYNLDKRRERNKSIAKNSGNFLSLKASYRPDLLIASNDETVGVDSNISFIPTWGIRRSNGIFNYEVGAGIGYGYSFDSFVNDRSFLAGNLVLRLGLGW
jgi:hypothetical protein